VGVLSLQVGDNPGLTSSRNQKWYAHATNHFWRLLHDSGFLATPLTHLDDHKVLEHKVRSSTPPCLALPLLLLLLLLRSSSSSSSSS
jgi:hypothetical protein